MNNYNSNIDKLDSMGNSSLHAFVYASKSPSSIEDLIKNGAKVNQQNHLNVSPSHIAASLNHTSLEVLLNHGADINARDSFNSTPLHNAVEFQNFESVKTILSYNPNIFLKDLNGNTPIMIARKIVNENSKNKISEQILFSLENYKNNLKENIQMKLMNKDNKENKYNNRHFTL